MFDSAANQPSESVSGFAVRLFHVVAVVFGMVGGLAWALIHLLPAFGPSRWALLPGAFWVSSGFLLLCSVLQHRSIQAVRREKQRLFRRLLFFALLSGMGFVAVQAYGLWCLLQFRPQPGESAGDPHAFVFVLTMLHVLHVSVAMMFLTYVFLKSRMHRYDHEYYWGALFCAWFWHGLGLVWLAIVFVFLIAT